MKNTQNNKTIEEIYNAAGPHDVGYREEIDASTGTAHVVYHPEPMPDVYPLLVWGNGTNTLVGKYGGLLRHLATWGIIAAGNFCNETGTGRELAETTEFLLSLSRSKDSVLSGRIDPERIAAAGHSQGSTGAIKAHTDFPIGKTMKAVIAVSLPALFWCDPEDRYDTSLVQAPFLVIGGKADFIISPFRINRRAVMNVEAGVPAFLAMTMAGHMQAEGDGGRFRGCITAWLRWWLCDDADASALFSGENAELIADKRWVTLTNDR